METKNLEVGQSVTRNRDKRTGQVIEVNNAKRILRVLWNLEKGTSTIFKRVTSWISFDSIKVN